MQKAESEQAIRHLCHEWARQRGIQIPSTEQLSFSDFFSWMQDHYRSYLNFRSSTSVRDDVERWFNQEFSQTWRE